MHTFRPKQLLFAVFMVILAASMVFYSGCGTTSSPNPVTPPSNSATPTANPATPAANPVKPVKQEITVVSDLEFSTGLQPGGFGSTSRGSPCPLIYEGLLTMGLDGVKGPSLAESWEVTPDGKQWTFHLKKGVKFHDGSNFTSADVKFTADWNGKYGSKMWWQGYQRVDCPDDYTAIVVFNTPRFTFDSEAALTEDFIMSKNTPINEKGIATQAIGTGPFKLVSIKPAEEAVLERNNDYWGPKARLDRVVIKVISDPETQAAALESGQVDAIQCYMKVGVIPRLIANPQLNISSVHSINGGSFVMNSTRAPFDDIAVRKALNYAIDRDTIINKLLAGSVVKSEYMLSPAFGKFVNKDVKNYAYDVVQAKQLLAGAGWKDQNGDGVLEKDGKPLAMQITYDANTSDFPRIAEFLQGELAKIGVKVTLNPVEYALVEKLRTSGQYDTLLIYTPTVPHDEPSVHYREVYSSTGSNHLLNNKEIDDLITQLDNTGDSQKRLSLHYQLQKLIMDQSVIAYLFDYNMIVCAKKSVQGIQAPVHSRWLWASLRTAYIQ
jgi:peptide/nickel transport system substrate-binding protein